MSPFFYIGQLWISLFQCALLMHKYVDNIDCALNGECIVLIQSAEVIQHIYMHAVKQQSYNMESQS